MSKYKLIVWGASGHAKVVADIIRLNGHEIVGFLDDRAPIRKGESFCEAPILGGREVLGDLVKQGVNHAIIGFGENIARVQAAKICATSGFLLVTAIHPASTIARDTQVGEGTVVAAGVVVNPGARIGNNVIVNTQAIIDHDCSVDDGAHVGPGANLAGSVHVERHAWIGIGATVSDHCKIGENSVVAAGAVVIHDVPANTVVAGVPAKFLRATAPPES